MDRIYPVRINAVRSGGTIYIVEYESSEKAKETALEKVKRLIMNEPVPSDKQAS